MQTNKTQNNNRISASCSAKLDKILTNKLFGYPIFLFLIALTFFLTFYLGKYPMDLIDYIFSFMGSWLENTMNEGWLRSLLVDGLISGIGSVIVFLPNILILYVCLSFLETSGYMARANLIMDNLMHKIGLHGESFMPLIMGFGCSVPAIMATKQIKDRSSRLITTLIIPFFSCSAKIPVYIILIGTFFSNSWLLMFGIYIFGVVIAIIMAKILSLFIKKEQTQHADIELPDYNLPTLGKVLKDSWSKCVYYLKKIASTILIASIVIWALGYFPRQNDNANAKIQLENSYMGKIGQAIEPVFQPLGMDYRQSVSLISGLAAKELVATTMTVLYSSSDEADNTIASNDAEEESNLKISQAIKDNMLPLSAGSMLIFTLLYTPCLSTIISIHAITKKKRYVVFTILYTLSLAWIMSFLFYRIASLI